MCCCLITDGGTLPPVSGGAEVVAATLGGGPRFLVLLVAATGAGALVGFFFDGISSSLEVAEAAFLVSIFVSLGLAGSAFLAVADAESWLLRRMFLSAFDLLSEKEKRFV